MNSEINKLFLNLNLADNPHQMIKKSNLKFEYAENQGIEWTGGNTKIYNTKFGNNDLIQSSILNGQIYIKQNEAEEKNGIYEILERIEFKNQDELMNEFYSLTSRFEKLGFKSKEIMTENENFEVKSHTNQIFIKYEDNIAELTFGYSLSQKESKNYVLIINFKNKIN